MKDPGLESIIMLKKQKKELKPLVSIIIPVYNGSNYLSDAIDSALKQDYENFEVIVVNDGSVDNGETERIAKSYRKKITYLYKKNGGVASALNHGIKNMKGDFFSWLSHDDIYTEDKISKQVEALEKVGEGNTIIASNVSVLFENGLMNKKYIDKKTFEFIDIFLGTSANVGLNGCSLLIPRHAFDVCGLFDSKKAFTQDYDMWFRMKDNFKFILIPDHLVLSRRHSNQDSVKKQDQMLTEADLLHANFLSEVSSSSFENYFQSSKHNIKHIKKNYFLYKKRGFEKTATKIIFHILNYYHKYDINRFYKLYLSEINSPLTQSLSKKLTDKNKALILKEFNKYYSDNSYTKVLKIKKDSTHDQKTNFMNLLYIIKDEGVIFAISLVLHKIYRYLRIKK